MRTIYLFVPPRLSTGFDITICDFKIANSLLVRTLEYRVIKGKELKDLKLQYVQEIDFPSKMLQLWNSKRARITANSFTNITNNTQITKPKTK